MRCARAARRRWAGSRRRRSREPHARSRAEALVARYRDAVPDRKRGAGGIDARCARTTGRLRAWIAGRRTRARRRRSRRCRLAGGGGDSAAIAEAARDPGVADRRRTADCRCVVRRAGMERLIAGGDDLRSRCVCPMPPSGRPRLFDCGSRGARSGGIGRSARERDAGRDRGRAWLDGAIPRRFRPDGLGTPASWFCRHFAAGRRVLRLSSNSGIARKGCLGRF